MLRYGCSLLSIALATWARLLLNPVLAHQILYPTLLAAVPLTAWFGGVRPALLAVLLGVFSARYFLILPRGSLGYTGADHYVGLALYLRLGDGVALLGGAMQAAPLVSDHKLRQARQALSQSGERIRLTLHSSGIAVWSWDIMANLIEADENCSVLFGLPAGRLPQTLAGFTAFVHTDDRERVLREIIASVEQRAEYN